MDRHRVRLVFAVLVIATLGWSAVACTAGSGGLGPVPTPTASSAPSADAGSPPPTSAGASASPRPTDAVPSGAPRPSATPVPSASPAGTTLVRAYFILADGPQGGGGLVPVLVEVPATKAVARAAMTALLAGYASPGTYRDIYRVVSTAIPSGTRLLGIDVAGGVATIDLSGEFASGGGSASMFGRLGQVVYTLTQFPTITSVAFRVDGRDVKVFGSEGIVIDHPLTRADMADQLPPIFVDAPAWGGVLANPGRVIGSADVFEAQFRVAIVARDGTVLVDVPVTASCGTGCRGTFDVTIPYRGSAAGWGTLRVYDRSEKDGSVVAVREMPVYLSTP